MEHKEMNREIFWFCAATEVMGLLFLAALIWIPVPHENQSMANIAIGFITATVIGIPLTYLLGGNLPQNKKNDSTPAGTTTASITADIVTDNSAKPPEGK